LSSMRSRRLSSATDVYAATQVQTRGDTSPVSRPSVPFTVASTRRLVRKHLTDEWLIIALATALSIGFFVWYDAHGLISAFGDARIREVIARRVVVSRTP